MNKTSRLKRIAGVQDLGDKNIPQGTINSILQSKNAGVAPESVVFRKMMNSNTKFIVEVWALNNGTYAVFSGHFEGQWSAGNIDYKDGFDSADEAQLYVQENLQDEAEAKENLLASKKKFAREMMAAGKEPDYGKIAKEFLKTVHIHDKKDANNHYQEWTNFMNKNYPEWSAYPAFIWRGWESVTNSLKDETPDNHDDDNDDIPFHTPGAEVGALPQNNENDNSPVVDNTNDNDNDDNN